MNKLSERLDELNFKGEHPSGADIDRAHMLEQEIVKLRERCRGFAAELRRAQEELVAARAALKKAGER